MNSLALAVEKHLENIVLSASYKLQERKLAYEIPIVPEPTDELKDFEQRDECFTANSDAAELKQAVPEVLRRCYRFSAKRRRLSRRRAGYSDNDCRANVERRRNYHNE